MELFDYLAIISVGLATAAIRLSFTVRKTTINLNRYFRLALEHIPGACMIAMITPMIWVINGELTLDIPRTIAIIVAGISGFFIRSLYVIIIAGMGTLWLLKWLLF